MEKASIIGMIPARLASSRLPEKLLLDISGMSILQRVFMQCKKSKVLDEIVIVTDHDKIFQHCLTFHAKVYLSNGSHISGTDRIAEVATQLSTYDYIINIQGDEPFIDPLEIDTIGNLLISSGADIATMAFLQTNQQDFENPSFVKLVTDKKNRALYFSRAGIPYHREKGISLNAWKKHIGIYGFKRNVLQEIAKLKPTELELTEKLEQLRWLEHGYDIVVGYSNSNTMGIDTPEDLDNARRFAELNQL